MSGGLTTNRPKRPHEFCWPKSPKIPLRGTSKCLLRTGLVLCDCFGASDSTSLNQASKNVESARATQPSHICSGAQNAKLASARAPRWIRGAEWQGDRPQGAECVRRLHLAGEHRVLLRPKPPAASPHTTPTPHRCASPSSPGSAPDKSTPCSTTGSKPKQSAPPTAPAPAA